MECYKAEEMVGGYINHTLNENELEEFLEHVRGCPSCYEELEAHFIVNEALSQLSNDEETALDFKVLLEQDLQKAQMHLVRLKLQRAVVVFTIILAAAIIVGLGFLHTVN
ncbi:MAG: zf-HC2 domain-containing protein [Blautia sp.]|nr:zf-HC2 domain-containing protein [Blautia sp.]